MSLRPYYIIWCTDTLRLRIDPVRLMGVLPAHLPAVMEDAIKAVTTAHKDGTLTGAVVHADTFDRGKTNYTSVPSDLIADLICTRGISPLVGVSLTPMSAFEIAPALEVADVASTPRGPGIHRALVGAVADRLRSTCNELLETLEAITDHASQFADVSEDELGDYIPVPPEALGAILALCEPTRDRVIAWPIVRADARTSLGVITHSLQPKDGFGHALKDSTTAGLLQEHEGANAGDRHEQAVAALLPDVHGVDQ